MIENFQKNKSGRYHLRQIVQLDWSKMTKHFSVNTCRKFLSWHEARRQPSNWISPHIQILFILLVSYFNDVCCTFHLGKMFIRSLSIIFLYLLQFGTTIFMYYNKTFRWPCFFHLLLSCQFQFELFGNLTDWNSLRFLETLRYKKNNISRTKAHIAKL